MLFIFNPQNPCEGRPQSKQFKHHSPCWCDTHTHTHKLLMTSTHLSCFGSTLDQHVKVLQALNFICTHQSGLESSCSTNSVMSVVNETVN